MKVSTILSPIVGFRFFAFERWRGQRYFLSVMLFHAQRKNTFVDVAKCVVLNFPGGVLWKKNWLASASISISSQFLLRPCLR